MNPGDRVFQNQPASTPAGQKDVVREVPAYSGFIIPEKAGIEKNPNIPLKSQSA